MKTAISIPDELFQKAETAAKRLQMSRSELYSTALADFLKRRSKEDVTRRLNEVYATEPSDADPVLQRMALASLDLEKW